MPRSAKAKRGRGRETDYAGALTCEIAANEAAGGATDFEIAQRLGIHVATLYRWKAAHPEFREALKVGKDAADERVEASLYHRAVGYSHPAVKILQNNGIPVVVPYTEHVPPDSGCLKLWLTNRRGTEWKDKTSQEVNAVTQNVTITTNDPTEAARAYQDIIKGA